MTKNKDADQTMQSDKHGWSLPKRQYSIARYSLRIWSLLIEIDKQVRSNQLNIIINIDLIIILISIKEETIDWLFRW